MTIMRKFFSPFRRETVRALSQASAAMKSAHLEPAYRMANGELALDGVWMLPCRTDIIPTQGNAAGQPITVNAEIKHDFDCLDFPLALCSVRLCPFSWDALTLRIAGLDNNQAMAVLVPWFRRWFDEQDKNVMTPEGLYGVVHFMSDPEPIDDGTVAIQIDLGSAPESTLEELLNGLADAGASHICLS